eukprot:TRINITY_DN1746_c0_g4_i1.p1 TRINITY_DN1746_c0_g4~~TRINITY_DN1746_c0_g4_i1.p1  ORF type:complete len:307 (-),score=74.88 TRINITY_DN1746_c0_g4_i1:85-1005(-)
MYTHRTRFTPSTVRGVVAGVGRCLRIQSLVTACNEGQFNIKSFSALQPRTSKFASVSASWTGHGGILVSTSRSSALGLQSIEVPTRTITTEILQKQEEEKRRKKQEEKAKAREAMWSIIKMFIYTSPLTVALLSLTKGMSELAHWLHLEATILPHSASVLPEVQGDESEITSCNVTYVYTVGDRVIQKTQLRSPLWCTLTQLLGKKETYQVGQKVMIRSMREDPTFSKLNPLPFSWWTLKRSLYDPIGDFVDGKPAPMRGYELDKQRMDNRVRKPPPFKGRTRPPTEEELQQQQKQQQQQQHRFKT